MSTTRIQVRSRNKSFVIVFEHNHSWLLPSFPHHTPLFSEWMMLEADDNDDGMLSEDEVVGAFDSLAHGDDYWSHDEL